jgi:16S rRNA (adenine(1408)-N(1))-methyltransferase
VRHVASRHPDFLVIGVDANAAALRDTSRRFAAKPARGGLPNALLGRLALADAPGELAGLASSLTVLLPWGSLLRAVAAPDVEALSALRRLCNSGGQVRVLFGYAPRTDAAAIREHALPPLDDPATPSTLEGAYRDAGFAVTARTVYREEVRELPTTWAKRLAYSGHERRFVELRGRALPDSVANAAGDAPRDQTAER